MKKQIVTSPYLSYQPVLGVLSYFPSIYLRSYAYNEPFFVTIQFSNKGQNANRFRYFIFLEQSPHSDINEYKSSRTSKNGFTV